MVNLNKISAIVQSLILAVKIYKWLNIYDKPILPIWNFMILTYAHIFLYVQIATRKKYFWVMLQSPFHNLDYKTSYQKVPS